MRVETTQRVTLLKVEDKSFKNDEKREIKFVQAKIYDGEEIFRVTVHSDISETLLGQSDVEGIATFEITKNAGKETTKLKLVDFVV